VTEALASKTCTPCRGGIPPLTPSSEHQLRLGQCDGLAVIQWRASRRNPTSNRRSGSRILPVVRQGTRSRAALTPLFPPG
jgi:hypothetical protein